MPTAPHNGSDGGFGFDKQNSMKRQGMRMTRPAAPAEYAPGQSKSPSSEMIEEEALWREEMRCCYGMSDIIDYLRDFERRPEDRKLPQGWHIGPLGLDNIVPTMFCMQLGPRAALEGLRQNMGEQAIMGTLLLAGALDLLANSPASIAELDDDDNYKIAFGSLLGMSTLFFISQITATLYMTMSASQPGYDSDILKCAMGFGSWGSLQNMFVRGMLWFFLGIVTFLGAMTVVLLKNFHWIVGTSYGGLVLLWLPYVTFKCLAIMVKALWEGRRHTDSLFPGSNYKTEIGMFEGLQIPPGCLAVYERRALRDIEMRNAPLGSTAYP